MRIVYGDICQTTCDAIVNASNGIGYMGGKSGIRKREPGVAESIHYVTQGRVEAAARKECRAHSPFGYAPGQVFVTPACGLSCQYVLHAVTMRLPGMLSSFRTVKKLLPLILEQARMRNLKSIAIPLLGTGTGHLSEAKVMKLYHSVFDSVDDLDICVYIYRK